MSDNRKKEQSNLLLSLSGGGFRGYFQAKILNYMEDEFGGPLASKFALIAGTSIGGINALALAAEVPTTKMLDFYVKRGPEIFAKKPWSKLNVAGAFREMYSDEPLQSALVELFGDMTVADLKHNVIIPAVNYSTGKPQVIKTPHNPMLTKDGKFRLVDVALATSAAPTYFPIHKMDGDDGCYMVDGGLVANHPGLYAYIEAESFLSMPSEKIRLLHIGTMSSGVTGACKTKKSGFLTQWRGNLFNLSISAQESATENILRFKMGADRYFKIDVEPPKEQVKYIGLDKATPKAREILAQQARCAYQYACPSLKDFMAQGDEKNG